MEHENLATELLHEIKNYAKRWFIAFLVVVILWAATIAGFLWYISLPIEEYTTIENDDGITPYIGGNNEGDIMPNGEDNNSKTQSGSYTG